MRAFPGVFWRSIAFLFEEQNGGRFPNCECREQQRLETLLARTVGFPCARVRLADGTDVTLHSIESLNDAHSPEDEVEWGRALADFVAHQARWDAADAEIGYSRTDELIRQSETAESALLDDLPQTVATSIEGILAKLKVILRDGEHWERPDDFPWPHIRSVLGDLSRYHEYRSGDAMTAAF